MGRSSLVYRNLARFAYPLLVVVALGFLLVPYGSQPVAGEVRVLLIGSQCSGPEHWISLQSYMIENVLEFNGIPYDFFDIYAENLTQATLDQYDGVILGGFAMRWNATPAELALIEANMESGSIIALVAMIRGQFDELNSTVYEAIDVSVDGLENSESSIHLLAGATNVYDFDGDDGFVVTGGFGGKHVGMAQTPLGEWAYIGPEFTQERVYGLEFALELWMKNAFGVDARVTLPVITLDVCDTQMTSYPRVQALMDFVDDNKHRIRASAFMVTSVSAYAWWDTLLQKDEQNISQWGSKSLHGYDHNRVGAEGEDRDFARQYADMNEAVTLLATYFPRYKGVKACPNNSWNEATLQAMYENEVYYHSSTIRSGPAYKALYKSVIDAPDSVTRAKIFTRGSYAGFRYYPLYYADENGEAWIYSVDWYVSLRADTDPDDIPRIMKQYTLDWWTPVMPATHFNLPDSGGGAPLNPDGWMAMTGSLMDLIDHDSYTYRRWVDTYDYAKNIQRFDQDVTVNSVTVSGNSVTYDITANQPARFMTLKTEMDGCKVEAVTINGEKHCYFGDNYVHLPTISGNAVIVVNMTSGEDCEPHVYHIDPSGVVEAAGYTDDRIQLMLSGEFGVTCRILGSDKAFDVGTTRIYADGSEDLEIDVSSDSCAGQVELSLAPSSGSVEVIVGDWEPSNKGYRRWAEHADLPGWIERTIGDLDTNCYYVVMVDSCPLETCISDSKGEICFCCSLCCPTRTFEVSNDTTYLSGIRRGDAPGDSRPIYGLAVSSHPNPFGHMTTVSYELPERTHAVVAIYSVEGSLVRKLAEGSHMPGRYSAVWDGQDASSRPVAPGVYFCRLETAVGIDRRKIVLIR
jgi:hypothetical protein